MIDRNQNAPLLTLHKPAEPTTPAPIEIKIAGAFMAAPTPDGGEILIDPSQVAAIGAAFDQKNKTPILGVCLLMIPAMPPLAVRWGVGQAGQAIQSARKFIATSNAPSAAQQATQIGGAP